MRSRSKLLLFNLHSVHETGGSTSFVQFRAIASDVYTTRWNCNYFDDSVTSHPMYSYVRVTDSDQWSYNF